MITEFLEKLLESVDEAKMKGQKIGKLAKIRGLKLSKQVRVTEPKRQSQKRSQRQNVLIRSSEDNVGIDQKTRRVEKRQVLLAIRNFRQKRNSCLIKSNS